MANQIALLLPHLGGKAYSLRSAIVHAIGSLLHKAFDRSEAGGEGGPVSAKNYITNVTRSLHCLARLQQCGDGRR